MKVSIITVSFNSAKTIRATIDSVLSQTFSNIEYIIVDGASTDGTVDIVKSYGDRISRFVSEPDSGLYCAMNKGIKMATGDVVGILNSDDSFVDCNVIQSVVDSFSDNIDAIYGDVRFINDRGRVVRYYSSKNFNNNRFKFGFVPAHPSFYVRRRFYYELGMYKDDYKIAADFELLLRFLLINNLKCKYIQMLFVNMLTGGVSNKNFRNRILLNREIRKACRENGLRTNYFNIYLKYFVKIFQYIGN